MKTDRFVTRLLLGAACLAFLVFIAALILPSFTKAREQAGPPAGGSAYYIDAIYSGAYPSGARAGAGGFGGEATPGSCPSLDEEVWVIARPSPDAVPSDDDTPCSGALMAQLPGHEDKVPVPLKHTDVKARIRGYIATVDVTQEYHNPYNAKIEASYVFPLPENAAVNEFLMTIGERRIRGLIRDRQEAQKVYDDARSRGYVASLLTQERPNVFTQKVANIEPGREIAVNIKYFHTLAYADGWYEYVFPMVVAPRFNPPYITDGVGAVARGSAGISGQSTEIQYLRPSQRSGHDISLAVNIDAGVAIEEVISSNHVVTKRQDSPEKVSVALGDRDTVPNKDFVLRYRVAGERMKTAVLTHKDERGGFFTMMLYPPKDFTSLARRPLELVFVIDCSGSMSGEPVEQAKTAVKWALKSLQPGDSFQIVNFNEDASQLGSAPLEATAANVARGMKYVDSLEGSGGTMAVDGVRAALDFPHDPNRLRFVTFLTDGDIGNEDQVFAEVHDRLGSSRIFSFGIGSSPNRYMLDGLARFGKGAVAYLGLNDSAADVMKLFFDSISHPVMTDLTIDWGAMRVTEMYPPRIPDLFVGRPVILTGRFAGSGVADVRISGRKGLETCQTVRRVDMDNPTTDDVALPCVWARAKIAALSNSAIAASANDFAAEIKKVALDYSLMSAYTAFVATDLSERTSGDHGVAVAVPVPVPEGMRYDTTVME